MSKPIIAVRDLSKIYPISENKEAKLRIFHDLVRPLFGDDRKDRELTPAAGTPDGMFWALNGINFDVHEGERVGIIGRNGAGKSTLLKILSRVTHPTAGEAEIRGRVTALLEVGTGFNGKLSGRENIYLNASLHGLGRAEVDERLENIIEFSEIRRFVDMPLGHYSTGMRARLAFSVAAHLDPDVLILDEVLSVGDLAFQQKCLERIQEMTSSLRTLLFVSHSMASVARYCDRCLWINEGRIVEDGDAASVVASYSSATLELRSSVAVANPAETEQTGTGPPYARLGSSENQQNGSDNANLSLEDARPRATLVSARITDTSGDQNVVFPLNKDIVIHLNYRRDTDDLIVPGIALYGPLDEVLFWSVPPERDTSHFRNRSGVYEATVTVPAHLLNTGRYSVSITAVSPDRSPMKRHFVADRILSFQMVESSDPNDESRGILPRDFPGPLRPKLVWTHIPSERDP